MCGITGVFDFRHQRALQALPAMTQVLQHRGPDDEGYAGFVLGASEVLQAGGADTPADLQLPPIASITQQPCDVALGHRRLSILDLSPAGHNPLPNADGSLWITYNGEIYNYIELRAELAEQGCSFRSGTDTEVLLAAYQVWGVDCLSRLNGMFAFAIWDQRQKRLFCARDRFGIKPFYYYRQADYFAFASEIKGLVANPAVPKQASRQAIYDYLVNGSIVAGEDTFFEDVRQLPGGHALTLDADGTFDMWRYYHLDYQTHYIGKDYHGAVEHFRELITDAVRLRLRSDVPVGSSLSGGLDSSSIVALANHLLQTEQGVHRAVIGDQQRVFCAVYPGETFDEQPYMDQVIAHSGASSFFTYPDSDILKQLLKSLVWHQDEPFSSTSIFAQFCVMKRAREGGITVLLNGQGGDEVLGGYIFYYGYLLSHALRRARPDRFLAELIGTRRNASVSWLDVFALTGWNLSPAFVRQMAWRMGGSQMLSHKPLAAEWVSPDFQRDYYAAATIKHAAYPTLQQKLYDDVMRSSLPTLLRYEDRNSMAFSIEARVPFLDYRLVEFAFQLGAEAHIKNGWSKILLRDAMQGQLPEPVRWRRNKEGFTTPHDRWMREISPFLNDMFSADVRTAPYLSTQARQTLLSEDAGQIKGIWRLLNLESWLRAFDLS